MKKSLLKLKNHFNPSSLLLRRVGVGLLLLGALACGVSSCKAWRVSSCKAWRTITTTSSYVQQNDSAKVTTTISSKTTEEYVGVKKR